MKSFTVKLKLLAAIFVFVLVLSQGVVFADSPKNARFTGTFRLFDQMSGKTYDFNSAEIFFYEGDQLKVDEARFNEAVGYVEQYFCENMPVVHGKFAHNTGNGRFSIADSGRKFVPIDRAKLSAEMMRKIQSKDYTILNVPLAAPDALPDNADREVTLLSTYTTSYDGGDYGRSHNIHVTGLQFNGLKIAPGQTVSFLKTAAPAGSQLKEAYIILNEEFVKGIGGGQCQVSTTLFNAAIEAGLKIDHRRNHSLKVHYVKYGRDAMVSSSNDFVFTNNFPHDVFLFYRKNGSTITFDFYGDPSDKKQVVTWTKGSGRYYEFYRVIGEAQEVFKSYYND